MNVDSNWTKGKVCFGVNFCILLTSETKYPIMMKDITNIFYPPVTASKLICYM